MSGIAQLVEVNKCKREIDEEIEAFLSRKRDSINENNIREFLRDTDSESSARSAALHIPRAQQMKLSVADNLDGPRAKSRKESIQIRQREEQLRDLSKDRTENHTGATVDGVSERLRLIEEHLQCAKVVPMPVDFYERIKRIEDRIVEWESKMGVFGSRTCGHPCLVCQRDTPAASNLPSIPSTIVKDLKRKRSQDDLKQQENTNRLSHHGVALNGTPKFKDTQNVNIDKKLKQLKDQLLKKKEAGK